MSEMMAVRDVLARMKVDDAARQQAREQNGGYVVPLGSRWRLGDVGKPDCPMCRGTGYVRLDLAVGHPQFGKLHFCDCSANDLDAREAYRRAAMLTRASGLGEQGMRLRWETIRERVNPALDDAVTTIRECLARGWGWVYLWGPPGVGKTLALQVAVAESAVAGRAAAWVELADMLGSLRAAYATGDHETRVNDWRSVPVLALDEMGRANDTAWADEVAHRVLNYRYQQALGERRGVTLFAANYAPDHLGDALASRVNDYRNSVHHIAGADIRRLKRGQA